MSGSNQSFPVFQPHTIKLVSPNVDGVSWVPIVEKQQPDRAALVGWAADCPRCGLVGALFTFARDLRPMSVQCIKCRKWVASP